MILLVASYRPDTHDRGYDEKGEELVGNAVETATTDKDRADAIDKIVHRVDVGGEVCQLGHGARGGEQAAEKKHAHHEEPHHEDSLLHGVAVVGDDESETAPEESQQHCQGKDEPQGALAGDAIDEPREDETDYNDKEGYEPIGYELGKDERPLRHWGDVYLLNGAGLLLTHDVEGGQETAHEHHDHGKEGGYHEHLVVEVLVVEEKSGELRLHGLNRRTDLGGDYLRQICAAH